MTDIAPSAVRPTTRRWPSRCGYNCSETSDTYDTRADQVGKADSGEPLNGCKSVMLPIQDDVASRRSITKLVGPSRNDFSNSILISLEYSMYTLVATRPPFQTGTQVKSWLYRPKASEVAKGGQDNQILEGCKSIHVEKRSNRLPRKPTWSKELG